MRVLHFVFLLAGPISLVHAIIGTSLAVFGSVSAPLAGISLIGAEYLKRTSTLRCFNASSLEQSMKETSLADTATPTATATSTQTPCFCALDSSHTSNISQTINTTVYTPCPCFETGPLTRFTDGASVLECIPTIILVDEDLLLFPTPATDQIPVNLESTALKCEEFFFDCVDFPFVWNIAFSMLTIDALLTITAGIFFLNYLSKGTDIAKLCCVAFLCISMLAAIGSLFPLFYIFSCDSAHPFLEIWAILIVGIDLSSSSICVFRSLRVISNSASTTSVFSNGPDNRRVSDDLGMGAKRHDIMVAP